MALFVLLGVDKGQLAHWRRGRVPNRITGGQRSCYHFYQESMATGIVNSAGRLGAMIGLVGDGRRQTQIDHMAVAKIRSADGGQRKMLWSVDQTAYRSGCDLQSTRGGSSCHLDLCNDIPISSYPPVFF